MFRFANVQRIQNQIEQELKPFNGNMVELIGDIQSVQKVERGFRYVVVSDSIYADRLVYPEKIRVLIYSHEKKPCVVGERVTVKGVMRLFRGPRNPGEFNYRSFYRKQNIWATLYQDWDSWIIISNSESRFRFTIRLEELRQSINSLFSETIGGDASKLVSAITVGLREEVPREIKEEFANTGVIHILAVSGLHVGFVLIILFSLVKLFRLPYRWSKITIIFALIAYAILTGGRASVWRATIMASFYVVAPIFNREANLWNIIATSALILLVFDPNYIFDAGFLLSFSAVISIVFFVNQFKTKLPERFQLATTRYRILRGIILLFFVSLSAQIGTLPFTWFFFNRIPIISLIANVIIVPLIGILVSAGFAILLLGSWIPFLGEVIGNFAWFLSEIVLWIIHLFAQLPFAYLKLGSPSWINITQYISLLVSIFLLLKRDLWRRGVLVSILTVNLFIWPRALHPNVLDVIFLDVGQGDSCIIRIPTRFGNKTILIDAGMKNPMTDKGRSVVLPVLKHLGIHRIDLLVMSHPHDDHIGGVETILSSIPVGEVWDTYSDYHSELYQNIRNSVSKQSILYQRVYSGKQVLDFVPAKLFVLHPDSLYAKTVEKLNNASLVLKLIYGDVSFLFTGDLEREGALEMSTFDRLNHATVLKVGHHGSNRSSSQSFVDMIKPDYAVISVGERNVFGHPSEEVISLLERSGAHVFRTDRDRACWLKSNGNKVWFYHWR